MDNNNVSVVKIVRRLPFFYTVIEKEDLLKKLGANIRSIRTEKGISQKQLAYSIGKDQQSIQRLEVGKMNPTFFYLTQIASGLNVQVTELIVLPRD